jgi:hypothetical protein
MREETEVQQETSELESSLPNLEAYFLEGLREAMQPQPDMQQERETTVQEPTPEQTTESAPEQTPKPVGAMQESPQPSLPPWWQEVTPEVLQEHPAAFQLTERRLQAEVDRAIALARQGRLAEVHPKVRELLHLSQQEIREELEERQKYEQIRDFFQRYDEGDPEYIEYWRKLPEDQKRAYRQFMADYERKQQARSPVPEQVRQELGNELVTLQLREFMAALPEFSSLPISEQQKVYTELRLKANNDLQSLYRLLTQWEVERQFQRRGGARVAAEAERAAKEEAARLRLQQAPEPEVSTGEAGSASGTAASDDPGELLKQYFRSDEFKRLLRR